uniref:3'-5' exonuclease domain-containing protein n=1 Tax=Panagrolaimus davidi TaxID=227884 RepID=A0A914R3A3_9BILA
MVKMEENDEWSNEDSHTSRYVLDKKYNVYTIVSPKALNDFAEECLVNERPGTIGLDCEAGIYHAEREEELKKYGLLRNSSQKVTVLQLATCNWLCIIDVKVLFQREDMTDEKWKEFFEQLFHPETTIVGFATNNDIRYLYARFTFLRKMLQNHRRIFCLSKLSTSIRKNKDAFKVAFDGKSFDNNGGIAGLADVILEIKMDKKYQKMDWAARPLSVEQKYYAVKDALVPYLIQKEIFYRIQSDFEFDKAVEIMNNGHLDMSIISIYL